MSNVNKGADLYRKRRGKPAQETEQAKPTGTLAAGEQMYRSRRRGLVILPGDDDGTEVTFGNDAA